jgi:hypothetical protein
MTHQTPQVRRVGRNLPFKSRVTLAAVFRSLHTSTSQHGPSVIRMREEGLDATADCSGALRTVSATTQRSWIVSFAAGKLYGSTGRHRRRSITKLLDRALEAARNLPPETQDDIARVVLQLAGADDEPPIELTPEEQAALATSKAAAARGEFATDEQVRAVWAKHGL